MMRKSQMKKISVLYVCPDNSYGGSSRSLLNLILSVQNEVTPIVLFPSPGRAFDEFKRYGIECIIHPYIKLHQISTWKNVLLHPWRALIVRVFRYDVACAVFVKHYLKDRSIEVVHSNYSLIYIGWLLSKYLGAKHVWHVREFVDIDFHYKVYGGLSLLRKMINRAAARIAISSAIKKHWQMPNINTWVISNAICSKNNTIYIPIKEKYILYSAYSMSEHKGARRAIEAFAQSGMTKKGYVLKMVGNCYDDYKESLLKTILAYGILDYIKFYPCQLDLKPFFMHAAAYLMTSENEAFGRVTAEAMFYGCPVIAHATGGTLDMIENGETGYLYNTVDECAQLISRVCSEDQQKVVSQAQEFARNNLSQEVYAPKIMQVYEAVLNGK